MFSISQLLRVIATMVLLGISSFSSVIQAWEGHQRAPWVGTMLNGTKCDGGQVPFGPYDYLQRRKLAAQLEVVEESHFNADVESLTKGLSATAMGDIHYTLQTWPNHHRALNSALRYRLQHREQWSSGNNTAQNYPAECYLQRAMKFSPKDPIPYMLHGLLMHQMKQYEQALKSYRQAVRLQPEDIITQYNMGLTLVELKKYREAKQVADKVYAAGFPLPGLKRKLADVGRLKVNSKATQSVAKEPVVVKSETVRSEEAEQNETVLVEETVQEEDAYTGPDDDAAKQELTEAEVSEAEATPEVTTEQAELATQDEEVAAEQGAPSPAATTTPPVMSEEQLAILKQAMKQELNKDENAKTVEP